MPPYNDPSAWAHAQFLDEGTGYVFNRTLCPDSAAHHGVTTREGNLNLSFRTEPDAARVIEGRREAASMFGTTLEDLVVPEQVHAAGVAAARESDRGRGARGYEDAIPGADALVTNVPGLLLGVMIADCLPVFLFDPVNRAIGLAHSGWRGTVGKIAERTLQLMAEGYGTRPEDVRAAMCSDHRPMAGGCWTCRW
jgi:polyphenol oxidase